jgi:uncharacterized protein
VDILFDPAKNAINIAKHGLSLTDAAAFEMDAAVIEIDDRYDYGEVRFRAFGRVDGQGRCLVFTYAANAIRVISYRRARDKEMRRYE